MEVNPTSLFNIFLFNIFLVFLFNIFLKCIGAFFGSKAKIWHLNTVFMIYE